MIGAKGVGQESVGWYLLCKDEVGSLPAGDTSVRMSQVHGIGSVHGSGVNGFLRSEFPRPTIRNNVDASGAVSPASAFGFGPL